MESLGKLIVGLALGVAQALLLGWAVGLMWWWFVVPLGVRPIGMVHAIALTVVIRFLVRDVDWDKPAKKWGEAVEESVKTMFYIGLTLLVAYLLHFCI